MNAALYLPCAVLVWIVVLHKLTYVVRDGRNPGLISLSVAMLFLALTMTVAVPAVWTGIDAILGVPNLSALLSQASAMGFALTIHLLVLLWLIPEGRVAAAVRWHLLVGTLILGVMVLLFLRITPLPEEPTDFVVRYAGHPRVATYLGVYVTIFGAVQVRNTWLCWRNAREDRPGWQRLGLHLVSAASLLGLVYAVLRGLDVFGRQAGYPVQEMEPVARLVIFGGVVLASVGCTASSWGARASAAAAWLRDHSARVRLYRLWAALHRALPHIALEPPPASGLHDLLRVRDAGYRLTRRIIEINDAIVELRTRLAHEAYREAEDFCRRQGLSEAAVEAYLLRRALAAGSPSPTPPVTPPRDPTPMSGELVATEAKRLREVARAFRRVHGF
ncbi:hypothetical protein HCN51_08060 [Nonomuraea sp. FMUSA5-5]|uniref:DUF6545 domain-containing protein n=1 Tax=Nonomuraea composti TaxID=2720023 RepID=A0ABX1B0T7_9ACTN|nr:MAB_1171c family putative transporter [Nonomuraea sp. FMUSA5-5]NJP89401.1 hypothetical protein [Nonomuraea sp. FMUSA5-5]